MDTDARFHPAVLRALFAGGLMGIEIGREHGGRGDRFLGTVLAVEQLASVDASVAALVHIHNCLVNNLLLKVGTAAQQRHYLPLLAGRMAGAFAITEPDAGSDAFALRTTARKSGDTYVLNGTKQWISLADIAGVFLVLATVDPAAGHRGITAFIVDRTAPGLTVGAADDRLGVRALATCQLHLDDVRVPAVGGVLGEPGLGYQYAARYVNEARIGIGAQMVGLAQGCFDATVPYLLERQQFGRPVYEFQALQHDVAAMRTRLEAARLLVYNAARLVETGAPFAREAAMCKLFALEMAQQMTSKCVDWMGAVGFTVDRPQEKFYRDCKVGALYGGTTNMQLDTIARLVRKEYEP